MPHATRFQSRSARAAHRYTPCNQGGVEESCKVCLSIGQDPHLLISVLSLDYTEEVSFKPSTPRVYPSFAGFDGQTYKLTFQTRLSMRTEGPDPDLIFLATSPASSNQLLVKLVAGDHYGIDAHRKLAEVGCAPVLFGVARFKGERSAYVMEHLSPAEGWVTLHEYLKDNKDAVSHIYTSVEQLLDVMRENDVAHGDLRPNNIMIRDIKDIGKVELKVIDFDWAGESGKVRYPMRRNESIRWSAGPGEPILTEHDRTLLMSYLAPRS
jgi:serine/threonine protein kinase